jgi:hypothetical protein
VCSKNCQDAECCYRDFKTHKFCWVKINKQITANRQFKDVWSDEECEVQSVIYSTEIRW